MKRKNITKSQFKEFLENNRVYKQLIEIRNYTFDDLISQLKDQEERLNKLLEHIGEDPSDMNVDEKINRVLEVAYIDFVNNKMELFVKMTGHAVDDLLEFAAQVGFIPPGSEEKVKGLMKTNEIRQRFLSQTMKYEKNPIKFFEDKIENFQYVANQMIKKISKLYAMAKDDEQVTESIINWELHQKLMEKKYGKRKIHTNYIFKK
jgi:predicted CopG family antitoxin